MALLSPAFAAADFLPAPAEAGADIIARPALSYWQHVWLRFRQNRLALGALTIVLGLVAFSLLGPLFWPVDPAAQSIGSRSLGPSLTRDAQLVSWRPWQPGEAELVSTDAEVNRVQVVAANTEFVRLRWHPVPGTDRYAVYRGLAGQASAAAPGIPLDEVAAAQGSWLEDRLDLRETDYLYTILAYDREGGLLRSLSQRVRPALAIGVLEAQLEGLLPLELDSAALLGTDITLPAHPLGTDQLGRDMLSRLMHGGRISLFIGVLAPLCFVMFGALYGGVAAYMGGRIDDIMMRVADFVVALPFLLFMILFRVLFGIEAGESGIGAMLVAMILLSWPSTARLVRGQVLQLKELAFVQAARILGGRPLYIIVSHMLPNVMGVLLVSLSFAIPSAIFTEAFLSFIGLGVAPPAPSWGSMCNDGMRTMLSRPHELLFPAMTISLAVLAFNLLGDALRDAFDIRMRGGVGHG